LVHTFPYQHGGLTFGYAAESPVLLH
jgi:hypothetical protein